MPDEISALQLERHVFSKIHVFANDKAAPDHSFNLQVQNGWEQAKEDPTRYHLMVRARIEKDGDKLPPYELDLEIHGFFRLHPDIPEIKRSDIVVVNGSGILFGALREMVCNLTARGPHPMLTLSTIRFEPVSKPIVPQKD